MWMGGASPALTDSKKGVAWARQVAVSSAPTSCPALCRASTSCFPMPRKDVDGRDKPGHDEYRLPSKRAAVAARIRRLIGDARMIGAVRQPGDGLSAAEEEVGLAGIADR